MLQIDSSTNFGIISNEYIQYIHILLALRNPLQKEHQQAIDIITTWHSSLSQSSDRNDLILNNSSKFVIIMLHIFTNQGIYKQINISYNFILVHRIYI